MARQTKQHVLVIDDDQKVCQAIRKTLEQEGWKVTSFASAADCLGRPHFPDCDLVIADVEMPRVGGIDVLAEVRRRAPWLPVVLMTDFGDVRTAARAFKMGADDFIEKPIGRDTLLSTVEAALARMTPRDPLLGTSLTRAERRILNLILQGRSNKETARLLNRSVRTIEVHRNRIMKKMGVGNLVDLVKRAYEMGFAVPRIR
jgi:FixJ family two-component response regulator